MSKRKTKLAPEKLLMLVESYLNGNNSLGYLAKSEAISRTTWKDGLQSMKMKDRQDCSPKEKIPIILLN